MIDNIKLNGINGIRAPKNDDHTKKDSITTVRVPESDQLTLSISNSLVETALNTQELDQKEKISSIKTAIQQGNYEIDLDALAEAIIKNYS